MDFTELERSSFLLLQLERRTYRTILMSENVCDFIIVTKCLGIAHGRTQGMKTQSRFPNCSKPNLNMKGLEHGSHCSEQPLHGRECSQVSQGGPKQRTLGAACLQPSRQGQHPQRYVILEIPGMHHQKYAFVPSRVGHPMKTSNATELVVQRNMHEKRLAVKAS